jgi:hypothetical protein
MLKLTYTEVGLDLERMTGSIEKIVSRRTILAMRVGQSILVQPGSASFLIPADAVNLKEFKSIVKDEPARTIGLCKVDQDCYEISIRGTWIARNSEAHEGMLVTLMSDRTERFIEKLWMSTQSLMSSLA